MNKKVIIGLLVLFASGIVTNSVFAVGEFDDIKMVDGNSSTTLKTVFDWDETPWLYLKLPSTGWNVTGSWWKDPDSSPYFTGSDPTTGREVWHSLENWLTVRKVGIWNVDAVYFYANNPGDPVGRGSTRFTVMPEPSATILFLTGGALVGGRLLIRRRRK